MFDPNMDSKTAGGVRRNPISCSQSKVLPLKLPRATKPLRERFIMRQSYDYPQAMPRRRQSTLFMGRDAFNKLIYHIFIGCQYQSRSPGHFLTFPQGSEYPEICPAHLPCSSTKVELKSASSS